jgi:hypothetical protein
MVSVSRSLSSITITLLPFTSYFAFWDSGIKASEALRALRLSHRMPRDNYDKWQCHDEHTVLGTWNLRNYDLKNFMTTQLTPLR